MPTNNHDLNVPSIGDRNWGSSLNENFHSIDQLLKHVSSDGETYTPDRLDASNISGVRVADSAAEIQQHIDELDGNETGYDDSGNAERPGGGIVLLGRGKYSPSDTIYLKQGVVLAGVQPDHALGRNNHEWSYSVLSGENIPEMEPIIETEYKEAHHAQIRDLVVSGAGRDVHGIFINHTANSKVVNCVVARCYGHGYHARGSLDTFILDSCIQGGDYDNGTYAVYFTSENDNVGSGSYDVQAEITGLIAKSAGKSASSPNGNTALRNESSLIIIDGRSQITTKNANDAGVASLYNSGAGTPMRMHGVNFTAYEKKGNHCVENHGSVYMSDCVLQKGDIGMIEEGKSNSVIVNSIFERNLSHGLSIRGGASTGSIANSKFRANDGSGIAIENSKAPHPWSNIVCKDNGAWGIDNASVRGGVVPVISGYYAAENTSGGVSVPSDAWIRQTRGEYVNESTGQETSDGDGSTTDFAVTHGMDESPAYVDVTPRSEAASRPAYVSSMTDTEFVVTFADAPPAGTNNVHFDWYAFGESAVAK